MALSLQDWHILSFVLVPFSSLVGIIISVALGGGNTKWFSAGIMFAAGILLAGAFVDTIPEAVQIFEQVTDSDFPWATTLVAVTFLALTSIEVSAERFLLHLQSKGISVFHAGHGHQHEQQESAHTSGNAVLKDVEDDLESNSTEDNEISAVNSISESEEDDTMATDVNPFVGILLVIVLSIHDVLEGLALGASDSVEGIRTTFIAIVLHRPFAGFALGSSLVAAGYWQQPKRKWFYLFVVTYLSMDFIGQGVGLATNQLSSGTSTRKDHDDRMLLLSSDYTAPAESFEFAFPAYHDGRFLEGEEDHHHDDSVEGSTEQQDHGDELETDEHNHEEDISVEHKEGSVKTGHAHDHDEEVSNGVQDAHNAEEAESDEHGHNNEEESSSAAGHSHEDATLADAVFHSLLGGSFLFITLGELIPLELQKTRTHQYPIALIMGALMAGFTTFTLIVHYTTS